MENIWTAIWSLTFLVQYGGLAAGVVFVGAIVASAVYELVRNKVRETGVAPSTPVNKPVEVTTS